jgi:hypothetical protein
MVMGTQSVLVFSLVVIINYSLALTFVVVFQHSQEEECFHFQNILIYHLKFNRL